jgi:hypothetical protein
VAIVFFVFILLPGKPEHLTHYGGTKNTENKVSEGQNKSIWSNIVYALAFIFIAGRFYLQCCFPYRSFVAIGKMVPKQGRGGTCNYDWLFYGDGDKPDY